MLKSRHPSKGIRGTVRARLALCALAAVLVSVFSPSAFAQSVALAGEVIRGDNREAGLDKKTIGFNDCSSNEQIEYPLTLVQSQGYTLQVWAGLSDACDDDDQRATLESTGRCWPVYSSDPSNRITLRVRDMLPREGSSEDGSVCNQGEEGSLTLFFMLFEGANSVGTGVKDAFKYDLVGPRPPTLTRIGAGERRLFPVWEPETVSDLRGYRVFCEASAEPEPGAGGESGNPDSTCPAPTLRPGSPPPADLRRGSAPPTGDTAEASGLENGVVYACGVAGFDELGNVGDLSNIICGTPAPVVDYFEAYRGAGGKAGGGFCRFGRASAPHPGWILTAAALALGLRRVQRSRSRR